VLGITFGIIAIPGLLRLGFSFRQLAIDPQAEDPWGPIDPVVIISGVVFAVGAFLMLRSVPRLITAAATVALPLLRVTVPDLTLTDLRQYLRSPGEFGDWAFSRRVAPVYEFAPLKGAAMAQESIVTAVRSRGTYDRRAEYFGAKIARRYRRIRTQAWSGFALVVAAVVSGAAALLGTLVSSNPPHAALIVAAISALIVGEVIVVTSRVRLLTLGDRMAEVARSYDSRFERTKMLASLSKPLLFEEWLTHHVRDAGKRYDLKAAFTALEWP
jgi:hypothetical protein